MSSKANVIKIIRDHCATLYDDRDAPDCRRPLLRDIAFFFILPLVVGAALGWCCPLNASDPLATDLLTAMSILAGLLFNMLLLVLDLLSRQKKAASESGLTEVAKNRIRFVEEVFTNISFDILVGIAAIALLLAVRFVRWPGVLQILSSVAYALAICFILTLLMVLKRVYALLSQAWAQ